MENIMHNIILNMKLCSVCFGDADFETSCGHRICFCCFDKHVNSIKLYPVPCFDCQHNLTDEECEENIGDDIIDAYLETKAHFLSMKDKHKFQCYNTDCHGIFNSEGKEIDHFICGDCNKKTCLKCRALHTLEESCVEWEKNNEDLVKSRRAAVKEMKNQLRSRHGMNCVECGTFIQKIEGCDGITCTMCNTALCFKTKKRRWGPKGVGDSSDGCKCDMPAKKPCHPRCKGCH